MKHYALLTGLCLSSTACANQLGGDGLEDFGKVRSALWLVDDDHHSLVLSNVDDLCSKTEVFADEYGTLLNEFFDALGDSDDGQEACEVQKEAALAYAELQEPVRPAGAHYLQVGFYDDGSPEEPRETTWETEVDRGRHVGGSLKYYGESLGTSPEELWEGIDCGDPDWEAQLWEAEDRQVGPDQEVWLTSAVGELDVTKMVEERRLKGTFTLDLVEDRSDRLPFVSTLEGRFAASWCEVDTHGWGGVEF